MYGLNEIQAMNAKAVAESNAGLKIGDTVYNGYGEEQVIVGESANGYWWIVENVKNGAWSPRKKSIDGSIVEEL